MVNLKNAKPTSKPDELRLNCPFCVNKVGEADIKYKLYINTKKGVINCFRCGTKGSVYLLGGGFLPKDNYREHESDLNLIKSKIKKVGILRKNPAIDLELVAVPLSTATPIAYEYIKNRGFTDEEIEKYRLHVGVSYEDPKTGKLNREWSGRIIFPFFENGRVVFLVGRSYNNSAKRYNNSVGDKNQVVYGIDSVQGECIIAEGIISAIAAERATGFPAVSLLGKTISPQQLAKLRAVATRVYVCLDNTPDVTTLSRNRLNRQLIKAGLDVWEIRPPLGNDPDDTPPDEFVQCFNRAQRVKL